LKGKSFTETAAFFKSKFGIQDEIEKIKSDWNSMAWELYKTEVTLKENVLELLKLLKKKEIKMAIATSNSQELVDLIFDRFNLGEYFTAICTSCEVSNGKPLPDVFLKAAEKIGIAPEKCLAFEDIPAGVLAAKRAGMTVFAIEDESSLHLKADLKKLSDQYFENYSDAIRVISLNYLNY